ncbi:(E3-independent) E2 ubiquitin-conjugating enzyme UBE2O isoform X2 [Nematostella vectensis]|uniref:(E3-independent) E2 ubiquitin-conjugating enzyme UBE2O isoform X2 n=1 Tax=Nematostella vectensis TaxID=45351 RepID=UPI002077941D|nr:(E3-independent) E2 ubiquitin-conjugating enzyme UBE2O isoform X2 [Nematostella vectensis]
MAYAECCVYAEDIVKNSHGNLGLVLQDAEASSEDESDSEDEALKKGQIVVCWYPSGQEETVSISKIQLADRSLLPGDVVKHADQSRPIKQKGFISDVEVIASVKVIAANQVVTNIDCRELSPLQELVQGVHVTLGPWLGQIMEAELRLVLRVKNGARCCLEGEQVEMLYDLGDQRDDDSPFYSVVHYPGQLVSGPAKVFKEAKWLSGTKPILHNQTQVKATVEEVKVVSCEVNWLVCGACHDGNTSLMPPDPYITKDQLSELNFVNHFKHASIQIGDKAFYTVKERDMHLVASHCNKPLSHMDLQLDKTHDATSSYQSPHSDSLPEDGEIGAWAKGPVDESVENMEDESADIETAGARNQDEDEMLGDVSKLKNLVLSGEDETVVQHRKGQSAQTRKRETQNHVYDSGDADEDSDLGDSATPKHKSTGSQGPKHDPTSGPTAMRFPKRRRKRNKRKRKATQPIQVRVGDKVCVEVTCTRTLVHVIWQDGSREENISSTDLIPVFHLDEQEFFPGDFISDKRESADQSLYGTVLTADCASRTCNVRWFTRDGHAVSTENDISVYDIAEHPDFVFNAGDIAVRVTPPDDLSLHNEEEVAATPSSCVGQVASIDEAGNVHILWIDGSRSHVKPQELYKVDPEEDGQSFTVGSQESGGDENDDDEWETASDVSSDEEPRDSIISYGSPEAETAQREQGTGENDDTINDERNKINEIISNRNPAFMMIESVPTSHAFKNTTFSPENQRKFLSCLRKELMLLQSSLPEGILVRGYEDRMDIFRVMIEGPAGTPYDHGLFAFDILLPANYPDAPPSFHYLSMCNGRLNPNLYEDGKVCVSLLGTWTGRGSEIWTSKSNILQVLISVQGLILNDEPYFNEAGYEKQRGTAEGLENSRLYNEMVVLKLLQSMERILRRPPEGFENEVVQHFMQNADSLIQKLSYWIKHYEGPAVFVTKDGTSDVTKSETNSDSKNKIPPVVKDKEISVAKDKDLSKEKEDSVVVEQASSVAKDGGFCTSLNRSLEKFKQAWLEAKQAGIPALPEKEEKDAVQ